MLFLTHGVHTEPELRGVHLMELQAIAQRMLSLVCGVGVADEQLLDSLHEQLVAGLAEVNELRAVHFTAKQLTPTRRVIRK